MRLIDKKLFREISTSTFMDMQDKYPAMTLGDAQSIAVFSKMLYEQLGTQIDALPVVRGEWIVTDAYPHRVYCSLCHKTNVPNEESLFERNEYPKFCMWCGAKMEDKP